LNGAQDLGGQMGFGRVDAEPDEPWFHAEWEKRAFGLTLAMGATGAWNLDTSRHARESLHPAEYLSSSYYEIWAKGLEKLSCRRASSPRTSSGRAGRSARRSRSSAC